MKKLFFIHQTPIDPGKVYGELFSMFADQLDVIKQRAADLYKEAHDAGVSPDDMDADYALVELDLAEYTEEYELFTGLPEVRYSNPTVDEDECDGECCDKTEEGDDD